VSTERRQTGSYGLKFVAAGAFLIIGVTAAMVNLYLSMSPALSTSARSRLLSGLVTIFLILVVGLIFISAAFIRETILSLRTLADRARRIEDGELDTELEANRNDEFGEVYRALSSLRDGLKTRDQQLDQRNDD
jgi:methyl-accepting chemotaxis protein